MKGIVTDKKVLEAHDLVGACDDMGNKIDVLGPGPVLERIKKGNYVRPQLVVSDFKDFFDRFEIEPTPKKPIAMEVSSYNNSKVYKYKYG